MPLLDMSDAFTDVDLLDTTLICTRNAQTVDSDGFPSNTRAQTAFSGVVTTDRSLEARRMAAGQDITGAILIITQFQLTAGKAGFDADLVTYRGRDYRVTFVDDYAAYGAGFVQAHCEVNDPSGGTPSE